jgi:hypothetical protein
MALSNVLWIGNGRALYGPVHSLSRLISESASSGPGQYLEAGIKRLISVSGIRTREHGRRSYDGIKNDEEDVLSN